LDRRPFFKSDEDNLLVPIFARALHVWQELSPEIEAVALANERRQLSFQQPQFDGTPNGRWQRAPKLTAVIGLALTLQQRFQRSMSDGPWLEPLTPREMNLMRTDDIRSVGDSPMRLCRQGEPVLDHVLSLNLFDARGRVDLAKQILLHTEQEG
jgi:hypothetical protein